MTVTKFGGKKSINQAGWSRMDANWVNDCANHDRSQALLKADKDGSLDGFDDGSDRLTELLA